MLLTIIYLCYFFNNIKSQHIVDTRNVIVIQNSKENTLFGYSLAFLKGQFGDTFPGQSPSVHGTLFIGSPKESTSRLKNSGVIWACQFNKNGSVGCSILSSISDQASPNWCKPKNYPYYTESTSIQWIGASLVTSSQHLYACAPRWKLHGVNVTVITARSARKSFCHPETSMPGACYMATSAASKPTILSPFYEKHKLSNWARYTQFGFSSHATHSNKLIFGVPSSVPMDYKLYWGTKGAYMKYNPKTKSIVAGEIDSEFFTYLGYSVTSGHSKEGGEYVAVSAPRAENLCGSVLIDYSKDSHPKSRIVGEQIGAYFGYSLVTIDLNGDGYSNELLIGAPMFIGNLNNIEDTFNGGAVYVYNVGGTSSSPQNIVRIYIEDQSKGARFGSAIANLGDINFDKKDDFVVSAPYHDDGVGSVFIYYGGFPLSKSPAQIIKGKSLEIPNLLGFGTYLLSENLDVDDNHVPDLAISSFESNHVVVLRTRPVAKPAFTITYHSDGSLNELGEILRILPSPTENKFRVRICISFQFSVDFPVKDFQLDSTIKYEVNSAAYFDDENGYDVKYSLNSTEATCLNRRMKVSNELLGEQDRFTNIRIRTGLSYSTSVAQNVTNILSLTERQTTDQNFSQGFMSFNPFLPVPIPTVYSEWEFLQIAKDNCDSDNKPECDPELKLKVDMHFEDGQNRQLPNNMSFRVGQAEAIVLKIRLSNRRETAYRPALRVALVFTDDFDLPKTEWRWSVTETAGRVEIFRGNTKERNGLLNVESVVQRSRPLQNESNILYELRIGNLRQMKVSDHLEGKISLRIEAFPENQTEKEMVTKSIEIQVKADLNISITTLLPSTGQNEIDPESKLVDLTQIYIINNTGVSSSAVDKVKIEIFVPTHALIKGQVKKVLGIVNPSQLSSGLRCEAKHFSFYKPGTTSQLEQDSEDLRANPEQQLLDKEFSSASFFENFITFSGCNDSDHQHFSEFCRKIICLTDLPALESRAVVIKMYLFTTATIELISGSTAGIRVHSSIYVRYLDIDVTKEGETWRKFKAKEIVAIWILGVAAGGGIILQILVVVTLYKCGFFRRKRREQLKGLKRQTMLNLSMNAVSPILETGTHPN